MTDELIFHLVTKEQWKAYQMQGEYHPESIDTEGYITAYMGDVITDVANDLFSGKEELLLVVIDPSRLRSPVRLAGEGRVLIMEPVSMGAVLDKIEITPGEDGKFDIGFSSN